MGSRGRTGAVGRWAVGSRGQSRGQIAAASGPYSLLPIPHSLSERVVRIVVGLLALAIMVGCAADSGPIAGSSVVAALSGEADDAFRRAYEPQPLHFPQDHGAHPDFRTEWWYFTGNLADAQGQEFGYQFTIFRSALTPHPPERESDLATNQVYMAHFALTDVGGDGHASFERFSRGAGGLAGAQGDPTFAVWLEDWSVQQQEDGAMHLQAEAVAEDGSAVSLVLRLVETRPPVLHGDAGLSQKGPEPGNASYYYSLVGLETSGTVTLGERSIAVTGHSWMDHEFGTSALSANALGWDWFSLQLDNGLALMFAQIRTDDGGSQAEFEGTLIHPDGTQQSIRSSDFTLETLGQWTSPDSGITYPSGWRVRFPAQALELEVTPLVRDQEMDVSFVYWEGAVSAQGTVAGAPVSGRGYVELTGYGSRAGSDYQR